MIWGTVWWYWDHSVLFLTPFFLLCSLPGGRQTIRWSWAGASFLASHDAFWSTSELHIIFTLIANVNTTAGTVYCRKLCNLQQIILMRWWTTMCCQSGFKALWHWLLKFLELNWTNAIPFFQKTFPCLVLWWWRLSAVKHVGPESPYVFNGEEESGDSEGHSAWLTSFSYSSNHSVTQHTG